MKTIHKIVGIGALGLLVAHGCDNNGSGGMEDMSVETAPDLTGSEGEDLTGSGGEADMTMQPDLTQAITLTQIMPQRVSTAGGTALTLTGSGFVAGATVTVAGVPATNPMVSSMTQLLATAPAKPGVCGTVPVQVSNPDGAQASASDLLSYFIPTTSLLGNSFVDTAVTGAVQTTEVYGTAVVDFSGDGKNDIVAVVTGTAAAPVGKLVLFANDGTGAFKALPATIALGDVPRTVAIGDLNGDKFPDAVIANMGNGTAAGNVSVLLGNGTSFGAGTMVTLMDTKVVKPRAAVLADMNGDAKQDIVLTDENNGKVYVVFGKGDGTFDGAGAKGVSLAGASPAGFAVAVGDFNGDKFPDVVAVDGTNNRSSISVLLNDGKGALGVATAVTVGLNPRGVATGDFDQDGKTDIAVTNLSGDSLMILRGDGAGKFGTGATLGQAGPRGIWVADVNGI